jgi:hypothetical protein
MPSKRRPKFKGWIPVETVDPELLEKIKLYNERFEYYCRRLSSPTNSTGNGWEAHSHAQRDVPLTKEEMDIRTRITPYGWDK